MLKGDLISLVKLRRRDLAQLKEWRNNPDYRKHFREYKELSQKHQETWYGLF